MSSKEKASPNLGASLEEYTLHKEYRKRHVNLVVRQRIIKDTMNPFSMKDRRFKELYIFDRATARKIIIEASRYIETPQIPIMIRIFDALHYLIHGRYQRNFAQVLHKHHFKNLLMVADALQKLSQVWVKFPESKQYDQIKKTFFAKTRFPDIIGVVDCHQFRIKKPKGHRKLSDYVNPTNRCFSFNIQLICDFNSKIFEAICDSATTNDITIWETSRTNAILRDRYGADKANDAWLLGDSRYKLTPWVLTPFKPATNNEEEIYNKAHSKARNCGYRLMRSLKATFKCLICLNGTVEQARTIFDACTVLHNMMLDRGLIKNKHYNNEEMPYYDEHADENNTYGAEGIGKLHEKEGLLKRDKAKTTIVELEKQAKEENKEKYIY